MARPEISSSNAVLWPSPVQPQRRVERMPPGIAVREEPLGTIKAHRFYMVRCECGRPWFEIELPKLVQCPACAKFSAVSL